MLNKNVDKTLYVTIGNKFSQEKQIFLKCNIDVSSEVQLFKTFTFKATSLGLQGKFMANMIT